MEEKDDQADESGAVPLLVKTETDEGSREENYENYPSEEDISSDMDDGDFCLPLIVKMEEGTFHHPSLICSDKEGGTRKNFQSNFYASCFKKEPRALGVDDDDADSGHEMDHVNANPIMDSSELIPSSPSEDDGEYETGEVPNISFSDSERLTTEPVTNGKMQECPHCEYRSRKSFNVRSHIMAKHTKQKPHKCLYCNYRATQAGHLKVHTMYKHTNEKPHQCTQCDFRATRFEQVRCHVMAKHTNEKPYPCPYCEYRATESGTLKSHIMAKHTYEKPHQCPHCEYRAIRSSGIRKHILNKHTFEKPHQCPFCGYRARLFSQLRSHIIFKHTTEAPYQCPHCEYRATQSGHLRRHIFRKHKLEAMAAGITAGGHQQTSQLNHNVCGR